MTKPSTFIVIGAGSRGTQYASYALEFPRQARCVGVAEPREYVRRRLAEAHGLSSGQIFTDWRELLDQPRLADAAFITTLDDLHTAPAVALAEKGYHLLLEKPMAPTEEECQRIVAAVQKAGVMLAVCHVLRYTAYTRKLKQLLAEDEIGEVVGLNLVEPIGWWHFAHSFVRGNWRREDLSNPMLMAKSCHDLDWILHIMGGRCESVASFGGLKHFRREEAPQGSTARCLDCPLKDNCVYSAKRIYLDWLREENHTGWPVNVMVENYGGASTEENVLRALREGPYGRCVYRCDNDVMDNQVVSMQFDGRRTANFTVTAFTEMAARRMQVYGTRGEIHGDGRYLHVFNFHSKQTTAYDTESGGGSILGGHGGGDFGLMRAFVAALNEDDPSKILSGPEETLLSHRMVFVAERSRNTRQMIDL